jgi:hypothetical protein
VVIVLAVAGGTFAWFQRSGSPPVTSASHKAATAHIVFLSDQSVILPRPGATYHFVVEVKSATNHVLDEPVQWYSSAPGQVTVTRAGVVTARVATGSATIVVSARDAQAQAAQVTVIQPAPGTLLIPSSDVLAVSLTAAKLKLTSQTKAIKTGEILVSNSRGGLLAKVRAVAIGSGSIQLTTTPASLTQAFDHLSIYAKSAPVNTLVSTKSLRSATTSQRTSSGVDARLAAVVMGRPDAIDGSDRGSSQAVPATDTSDESTVDCNLTSGAGVAVSLKGPSVSIPATVQLVGVLETNLLMVEQFELAVQATVPVVVSSGSVTVSAAGNADATCDLDVPTIDIPTPIFIGPVEINGEVDPTAGVDLSVDAGGAMTFAGPTVSDTATALDGIEYTADGGWQAVEDNSQTGVQVTPGGSGFDASLTASASPDMRVDFGISAVLGDCDINLCTTLAGANLAFAEAKGSFDFQITSPFDDLASGYAGPIWSAGVEFTAGPELVLSGDIVDLFDWIGVTPPDVQWNAFDDNVPLSGSPDLTTTASTAPGGAVNLAVSLATGFSGDTVKFVAYPPSATTGTIVAEATVTGTSAAATWTPNASAPASAYDVTGLLFDNVFGPVGLPYASAAVPVATSTTPTPSSSTTSTTTITPTGPITTRFFLSLPPDLTSIWGDTGVNVAAGASVSITASGTERYTVTRQDCYSTPAGFPWGGTTAGPCGFTCPDYNSVFYPQTPAPGLPCFSLIGRIGSGSPFEVGYGTTFVSQSAGELYLGYNDWYYPDVVGNYSGGFSTRIVVTPNSASSGTVPSSGGSTTALPSDQVLANGSYQGSTTIDSCILDYAINGGDQETLSATGTSNLFVGATAGGKSMTPISWSEDLAVTASYSGLEAISIGHSDSGTGTFQTGANDAIAAVAVRGCTASERASSQTSNGTTLSIDVPSSSRPVVILLGGEGTGLLSASGKQGLETLVNATFSEYGSDVIASTAIFVFPASASPTTIRFSSSTYGTNSGTSLGAVAYSLG